jgi:predicted dehydrogenase
LADGPPPDPEEWDAWLGPAPKVPYNPNRTYYRFRWFWDYSGGQMTNFGTHYVDMMRWCCGKEYPKAVTALGGRFAIDDNREIPDTLKAIWDYGDLLMTFSQFNANAAQPTARRGEIEIRGTKGTVYLNESSWEAVADRAGTARTRMSATSLIASSRAGDATRTRSSGTFPPPRRLSATSPTVCARCSSGTVQRNVSPITPPPTSACTTAIARPTR